MKKILSAMQAGLKKLESFSERTQPLEAELNELPAKIKALKHAVSGGDTKSCNALAVAQARLELLPGELAALQQERAEVINELRSQVSSLSPALAKIYNETFERIKKSAVEFLEKHLDSSYQVEQIAKQITEHSKELTELYRYKIVYEGSFNFNQNDPSLVISRAEYALANLGKY
jgi:DNA repair exonuclease SbcCD ATPase subunit